MGLLWKQLAWEWDKRVVLPSKENNVRKKDLIKNKIINRLDKCQFISAGFSNVEENPYCTPIWENGFGLRICLCADWEGYKFYNIYIDGVKVATDGFRKIKFIHEVPKSMQTYVIAELENIIGQKTQFELDEEKLIEKFK